MAPPSRALVETTPALCIRTMKQAFSAQAEYIAAALEDANEAIVAKDLNGIVTIWNRGATQLFGYSKEEMIGKSIKILIPPDRIAEEESILGKIRSGERVQPFDTVRLRKGGQPIEVSVSVSPILDHEGNLIGATKTAHDITEKRRFEQTRWKFVEASPVAMLLVDQAGRVTLTNSQCERLFGYPRKELIGCSVDVLLPGRLRHMHRDYRVSFMVDPQARAMGAGRDLRAVRKDGREIPVEIGLTPIKTEQGVLIMASIVDITLRKASELKLRSQQQALERSNRDLEQFAYVASHDLQEPLRAVAGCVQLLQKRYQGQIDERADQFIAHAVDGCKRMQTLIDDLLTFSRVGRNEDAPGPVDCEEALHEALRNLSSTIATSRAEISSDPIPPVRAEMSQMIMLFQNLVGNAIKFRKPGKIARIHIGAIDDGGQTHFTVGDQGIGIAPEHQDRIFGVFQRLHTAREYPGTGIGLAICKRIVERNGGRIWVESSPGQGTVFHFTLPRTKEEAP